MSSTNAGEIPWVKPLAAISGVLGLSILVLMMLGSQVSGILSTVGASVGGPYGGGEPGDEVVEGGDGSEGDGDTTDGGSAPGAGDGGVVLAAPRDELLIIKTGTLTLQVSGMSDAVSKSTTAIDGLGGFAAGSKRSGAGEGAQATITFRVPAARWDEAMNAVRGLAFEVLTEESTTEDVTSQVVDLGARIRNLQATERALQSIMDRAEVIKDVLSVQAELTTVRGQIEQLTAQKAHLEEQAAYSSLTVTFVLKPAPVLIEQQAGYDPATEVDAASASIVGVVQGLTTAGIWFGIVWLPILIALSVVTGIGVLVVRRFRPGAVPEPVGN